MSMVLYDLAGADPDPRFSPFCWRTRFALAHKGLPVETLPWRFTETDALAFSGQRLVPVLRDGARVVSDSWAIANYLEDTYPAPALFGDASSRAHVHFINTWADSVLIMGIARLIVRDIFDILDPRDRDYFRSSRERWFGMTLEQFQSGRDGQVAVFRESLQPVRAVVGQQAFLGGAGPSYADHIVAGTLMWPRCASRFPVLAGDDPVATWFGRMLDQYDGLGRGAKTP